MAQKSESLSTELTTQGETQTPSLKSRCGVLNTQYKVALHSAHEGYMKYKRVLCLDLGFTLKYVHNMCKLQDKNW